MGSARIIYTPHPDTTPEGESNALTAVYRFVLDCYANKKAAWPAPEPAGRDGSIKIRTKSKEAAMP